MNRERKKEKWFLAGKRADFYGIGQKFQVDPVIARLIRNRDVIEEKEIEQYLNPSLLQLHDPILFKDMEKSAEILMEKIRKGDKIRIISDYDVDGIMSNYILLKGFETLLANVDYEIPDRMRDGYGINERLIREAKEQGVDTIVTCDNGIAAYDQIAYAKSLGLTVIVTDHHDVPYEEIDGKKVYKIPPADCVINPKQADCSYPFPLICGATVALKLIQYLYRKAGIEQRIEELIEFSAIATVCDVVDLKGENRILVKEGLKRLNRTQNIGLQALIKANGLEDKTLSAYHLGFVIGPCLNASGRLDTAKRGLKLLLEENIVLAERMAKEVKELNDERKDMTEQGVKQAIEQVETTSLREDKVLVIYLPDCHESLAGIIAGRVREAFARPVFVMTKAEDGGLKGSGRSIEAYSMYEELTKCKELLSKFGGHPMAAGLSMPVENLELFKKMLNEKTTMTKEDLVEKVVIDVAMPIGYINERLIDQLDLLEPFGKGNPKPLFAQKHLHLVTGKILGKNKNVLKFLLESDDGCQMDGLFFGDIEAFTEKIIEIFGQQQLDYLLQGRQNNIYMDATYYPSVNEFRGMRTMQVIIQNYQF